MLAILDECMHKGHDHHPDYVFRDDGNSTSWAYRTSSKAGLYLHEMGPHLLTTLPSTANLAIALPSALR
jgi:hypothetical protein